MDEDDEEGDTQERASIRATRTAKVGTGEPGRVAPANTRRGSKGRSPERREGVLGQAIADEAVEEPRRELNRGERQRDQEDGQDDRDDRHDGAGDRGEQALGGRRVMRCDNREPLHRNGDSGYRASMAGIRVPRQARAIAIARGRTRNPPRSLYWTRRTVRKNVASMRSIEV